MSKGKPTSQGRAANLTWRGVMCNAVVAERKAGAVASDLFKLAQKCESVDEFLAKTQMEEDWVLSEEAGQMKCHEIPRCWVQAKSDIKGAFKAGLDLTKIPSYYKMKIAKSQANKSKDGGTEGGQDANGNGTQTATATAEVRAADHGTTGQEREAKPQQTVAEALAAGTVVDAKSTELVPADLRELVSLLAKIGKQSELRRAKLIKDWTKQARDDLSRIGNERAKSEGVRRAAS